jgi:2-keto-4-pentenoate hydratase/2-oxohepta-3-ene-1,7-dioic acid hydratase in catechol pathway
MKLLRVGDIGNERPALLDSAGQLRDLSQVVADIGGATLLPDSLRAIAGLDTAALPAIAGTPRVGPCVANVGKIVCVGLNYHDHAAEANMKLPTEPILFLKATSAIIGPDDDVEIPRGAEKTDWEVELGIVIGRPGKYIPQEGAFEHVAGYCVVNDISERSYQIERGGQWDKGKGCDTFAPIGPWLVTTEEIRDPQNLDLWLEVAERRVQGGNTRDMVFGVASLICYISQFMSLQTGDVIATGTPAGVGMGRKPPQYLRAGQRMRAGIEGLGVQTQHLVADRRT